MSDLIERLRDKARLRAAHGLTGWVLAEEALLAQAADEIERLTAERDDLLTKLDVESGSADMIARERAAYERAAQECIETAAELRRCADGCTDGRYDWKADGALDCADAIRALGRQHD